MPKNYVYNKRVMGRSVDVHCFDGANMPSDREIERIVEIEGSKHPQDNEMVIRIFPGRYTGESHTVNTFSGRLEE